MWEVPERYFHKWCFEHQIAEYEDKPCFICEYEAEKLKESEVIEDGKNAIFDQ